METTQATIESLQAHFRQCGMLLCNEDKDLPSLFTVGGDWNGIVDLMERGEVFYSKLYRNKVTYLSRALYYQIKPHKQRLDKLSPKSREILAFIKEVGLANTADIRRIFSLPGKNCSLHMDELSKELFITAIRRDKTINENWSSFCWGTYDAWEQLIPTAQIVPEMEALYGLLGLLTQKEIQRILR